MVRGPATRRVHAACLLHMAGEWKRRGASISEFGYIKKEIEALALKRPARLLKALKAFDAGPALPGSSADGKENFVSFG